MTAFPRYQAPLRAGSRIAVTAPSSGVLPPLHPRLDLNLAHLRAQGFIVEEGDCLRDEHLSASASADARATEFFPPWGGELAIELLDRLDWTALQHVRPKWLIGYSDTSTLMLALTLRLAWASAHGPCLMDLAPGQNDALTHGALGVLATPPGGVVTQQQSPRWQSKWTDFAVVPDTIYSLTEITQWRCLNRPVDAPPIHFEGRLIGGCIDALMHLAGSVFGNLPKFVQGCGAEGAILYLENAEMSPTELVRALHRFRWAGWFDGLAGLLIGRSAAADTSGVHELRYETALQRELGGLSFPVLVDVDIGHRPPQLMLVNGALADVDWSAADGGRVTQTLA